MPQDHYPPQSALRTGLACRCPRCGQGRVYGGFYTVVDQCDVCGLTLARNDSGDGPAVFLIFVLGTLAVLLAIAIEVAYTPPVWVHALVVAVFVIGATLATMRPLKAFILALQYRHRREDFDRPDL